VFLGWLARLLSLLGVEPMPASLAAPKVKLTRRRASSRVQLAEANTWRRQQRENQQTGEKPPHHGLNPRPIVYQSRIVLILCGTATKNSKAPHRSNDLPP
jgi:hypothetical protein